MNTIQTPADQKRKARDEVAKNSSSTFDGSIPKQKMKKSKLSSNYYDYNLAEIKRSNGGYIMPQNTTDELGDTDAKSSLYNHKTRFISDLRKLYKSFCALLNGPESSPQCIECGSIDLDSIFFEIYNICVCRKCKDEIPEKYSLLTKSESKQDYMLTEEELCDRELFKVWIRPNPHRSTYSNMILYVRQEVEKFAIKKWGSLEELDKQFEKRELLKKERKDKKFQKSIQDLRKRTRTEEWRKKRENAYKIPDKHEHNFINTNKNGESDSKSCSICGLTVEVEEF
ncbi:DNA repair protein rad14 [Smittium culicis]|uniref:DNA repair protein rad14 n=1 Tax=Smittium culicis TaxID=133412 RepID=A0A1R1XWG7_9FUNG|nr:DNA repair protein rad14 [Smittium culicis]